MSHEDTLRRLYAALNARDVGALEDLFAERMVLHVLPNPTYPAGTVTGRPAVLEFISRQMGRVQQKIDEISVNGDFATVYVTSTGLAPDGTEQTIRWADLARFEEDRICEAVSLFAS